MNSIELLKNITGNDLDFIFAVVQLFIASLLAVVAVLSLSHSKKMATFFFVLTAFFLFIRMTFRVLSLLHIFFIDQLLFNGIPLYAYGVELVPYLTFILAFIFYREH